MVNPDYPYVRDASPSESDLHIELKNAAVQYLLDYGCSIDQIETEHRVGDDSYGYTDVYAKIGSVEVYIECETHFRGIPADISKGGQIPAKRGDLVLYFSNDGIHRLTYEEKTITDSFGNRPAQVMAPVFREFDISLGK